MVLTIAVSAYPMDPMEKKKRGSSFPAGSFQPLVFEEKSSSRKTQKKRSVRFSPFIERNVAQKTREQNISFFLKISLQKENTIQLPSINYKISFENISESYMNSLKKEHIVFRLEALKIYAFEFNEKELMVNAERMNVMEKMKAKNTIAELISPFDTFTTSSLSFSKDHNQDIYIHLCDFEGKKEDKQVFEKILQRRVLLHRYDWLNSANTKLIKYIKEKKSDILSIIQSDIIKKSVLDILHHIDNTLNQFEEEFNKCSRKNIRMNLFFRTHCSPYLLSEMDYLEKDKHRPLSIMDFIPLYSIVHPLMDCLSPYKDEPMIKALFNYLRACQYIHQHHYYPFKMNQSILTINNTFGSLTDFILNICSHL